RAIEGARAVVFLFEAVAECYWRAYHGALDAAKIHIIPNGYDGAIEDFTELAGDKCTILYAGSLSTYRYDTLLQSLALFKKANPSQAKQLHLLFVGEGTEELAKDVTALELSDIIETAGPVSHAEITRLQRQAHALLILGRRPVSKGYELVAGAKLFGYLKARRPIIGVLPRDETMKVLFGLGVATVADVDSPPQSLMVLRRLLDAWREGRISSLLPDRAACEVYSGERQTMALVRALEGASAAEPFVPGLVEVPPSLWAEIGDG